MHTPTRALYAPSTVRRKVLQRALAAGLFVAGLSQVPLHAAGYPDKAVRIVVNFPPGGPLDIIARLVAARLATTLKQPFVVDNVTGASGNIGASQVARAEPDGYTILMSLDTPFTMTPALYPQTSVKADTLKPVAVMGATGSIVAVHPSLGVNTLQELIAKGRNETLTFSTAGNGSPGHFAALMLAEASGMKVNPIHYRGNAPAVLALLSGEVQAGVLGSGGVLPHVKAGTIKALAAAGGSRSSLLPDVPTAAELGVPGLDLEFLFVAMVPAKTPEPVVEALHAAIVEAAAQPDFQERMRAIDVVPSKLGGAELEGRLSSSRARYAEIVRKAGLKGE
ncbi:MAG: tripartite tricarboxylate transporter substrate binding protein [Variovorax sp.]